MKISKLSRALVLACFVALTISIFTPLWRIELDAPQYPEGLALLIYPNAIKGDVDIINGLNHYIGMQTLHAEKFIEFTLLPYLIAFYAALMLLAALFGKRSVLNFVFIAFVIFGIVAMVDFWRWEYDYGHNLDPDAAIKVPGMSYQPPLIGFKQLLNFGAYSIPDIGGWLFILSGILLMTAVGIENNWAKRFKKSSATIIILVSLLSTITSCNKQGPIPIQINKDECDNCRMSITDIRFAVELITPKNKVYKFDDISCLVGYIKENEATQSSSIWISDYLKKGEFIAIENAHFVQSQEIRSPMGGNTIALTNVTDANSYATKYQTKVIKWEQLKP